MLVFILRDEEGFLHVHPLKKSTLILLLRVEILLTARATSSIRGMNGRNHSMGVFRVQIGSPVLRSSRIGTNGIYTRERHAAAGSLASRSSVTGVTEPAEKRTECDETARYDTETGLDVGPDGDVGGCVCGKEGLLVGVFKKRVYIVRTYTKSRYPCSRGDKECER